MISALRNPYFVRTGARLSITGPAAGSAAMPFAAILVDDQMRIEFNSATRLVIKADGRTLFDGSRCRVLAVATVMVLTFEGERVEVTAHDGRFWNLGIDYDRAPWAGFSTFCDKAFSKSFLKSAIVHAAAFLLVFAAVRDERILSAISTKAFELSSLKQQYAAGMDLAAPVPFSGMGIKSFLQEAGVVDSKSAGKAAGIMAGMMKKFGFGGVAGAGAPGKGGSLAGNTRIDIKELVAAAVKNSQQSLAASGTAGPRTSQTGTFEGLSRRELLIRRALDSARPQLGAAFDEALGIDPSLSVTLEYRGVVGADGRLGSVKFKASGKFTPAALQTLERSAGLALNSVYINKALSGTVISGEHVFIK